MKKCEIGSKTDLYSTLIHPSLVLHETCWPDYGEPRFKVHYEHQWKNIEYNR